MKFAALVLALAACGKTPPAPMAPTPAAVGAELATFKQLLVPISTSTWARVQEALERKDYELSAANRYLNPYAHASILIDGKETDAIVAYTSVWLAPFPVPLQPMTVQQYLRAFGADTNANFASVISPQGNLLIAREQLPSVFVAVVAAGAPDKEQPYRVIIGTRR